MLLEKVRSHVDRKEMTTTNTLIEIYTELFARENEVLGCEIQMKL